MPLDRPGSFWPSCPTASARRPRRSSPPRSPPPPPPPRPRRRPARAATASTTPPVCCRSPTTPSPEGQESRRGAAGTGAQPDAAQREGEGIDPTDSSAGRVEPRCRDPHAGAGSRHARGPAGADPAWVEPLRLRPQDAPILVLDAATGARSRSGRSWTTTPRRRASSCSRSIRPATSPRAAATSSSRREAGACALAAGRRIKARRRFAALRDGVVRTPRYDRTSGSAEEGGRCSAGPGSS